MTDNAIVSVVATVYNEAPNIDEWLDALLEQSRSPDEIVIADGGSNDGTIAAIERRCSRSDIPIVFIVSPGANISQGRNLAIERASGSLIAVTDAGTRASVDWLERIIAPLERGEADVVAGFFVPRLRSRWERALAATTLPDAAEIAAQRFLPSSRSMAFRRCWFDTGVRYPEWLDFCEDVVWDLAMKRAGARFAFASDARVTFSVRPSPRSFGLQYFRYARGDGKAGLFARRHALRYATYVGLGLALKRQHARELLFTAILGVAYVARPLVRLRARDRAIGLRARDSLAIVPLVITLRALGDGAKMVGYPVGLCWRIRRFGGLGWRTAWPRVSPTGALFRPAVMTRGSQPPEASRGGESHVEQR